jgi:hypothetical protein
LERLEQEDNQEGQDRLDQKDNQEKEDSEPKPRYCWEGTVIFLTCSVFSLVCAEPTAAFNLSSYSVSTRIWSLKTIGSMLSVGEVVPEDIEGKNEITKWNARKI